MLNFCNKVYDDEETWLLMYDLYKHNSDLSVNIQTMSSRLEEMRHALQSGGDCDFRQKGKSATLYPLDIYANIQSLSTMLKESTVVSTLERLLLEAKSMFENESQIRVKLEDKAVFLESQLEEMKENALLFSSKDTDKEVIKVDSKVCAIENFETELFFDEFSKTLEISLENSEEFMVSFVTNLLKKLEYKEQSNIGLVLKKILFSYGNIISERSINLQNKSLNLNNNNKSGLEIEVEDLRKQILFLMNENVSLKESLNGVVEGKEETIKSLEKTLSESSNNLENYKAKMEELEQLNNLLEINLMTFKNQDKIIEKVKEENKSYKVAIDEAINKINEAENDVYSKEELLRGINEECASLRNQIKEYRKINEGLEQKVSEFVMENKQREDLELSEVMSAERENYENKLLILKSQIEEGVEIIHVKQGIILDNERRLKLLEEEVKKAQNTSECHVVEMKNILIDFNKLGEEFDKVKMLNIEKDKDIAYLESKINEYQNNIDNIKKEKENIIKDLQSNLTLLKSDSLKLDDSVTEYKNSYNLLEEENKSLRRTLDKSKDKIDVLEINYSQTIKKLSLLEEEKNNVLECKEELERDVLNLNNLSKSLGDEVKGLKNDKNELKGIISGLETKVIENEDKLCSAIEENFNLMKHIDELKVECTNIKASNKMLGDKVQEVDKKNKYDEERVQELLKEIRKKDEKLNEFGIRLKEGDIGTKEIESKNAEIFILNSEIASLRKAFDDVEENNRNAEADADKIFELEFNLKRLEFQLTNSRVTCESLEHQMESMRLKAVEAMHMHMKEKIKNKNLLEEIRMTKDINEINFEESNELENLRKENKVLLSQSVALQTLQVSYTELENHQKSLESHINENKEKINDLMKENKELSDCLITANAKFDEIRNHYYKLKEQYRNKRKATEELNEKNSKLLQFIESKELDIPQELL